MDEDDFLALASEHCETAIAILEGRGQSTAVERLRSADMRYRYSGYDNWDGGTTIYDIEFIVDARSLGDYTQEVRELIARAFGDIVEPIGRTWLGGVVVIPQAVPALPVGNQAVDPHRDPHIFQRNGMHFRSQAELQMFDALAKKQAELRKGDTILIVPLPSVWNGQQRWEPDFIVTYRGRAGVIEIDDPTHFKRYAADKSRDQVLEECGIQLVRRIAVEDAVDESQRDDFIETFLDRLATR